MPPGAGSRPESSLHFDPDPDPEGKQISKRFLINLFHKYIIANLVKFKDSNKMIFRGSQTLPIQGESDSALC